MPLRQPNVAFVPDQFMQSSDTVLNSFMERKSRPFASSPFQREPCVRVLCIAG